MKVSHKTRLSLVASGSVALILAVLFIVTIWFARQSAMAVQHKELISALELGCGDKDDEFDFKEVREAHPDLSLAIYRKGKLLMSRGSINPIFLIGFQKRDQCLYLGSLVADGDFVVLAKNWSDIEQGLGQLSEILAILWVPLVLLVGTITWLAAQAVFRPLERLNRQASSLSGTNFTERLTTPDRAEFGEFAHQLNEMLARIEKAVRREESFASDAAHELRTPLALMRTRLETTLLKERSSSEYVAACEKVLHELDRLTIVAESLLSTAKGQGEVVVAIDLEPIVLESSERWELRFSRQNVMLQTDLRPARSKILPDEIRIVLDNLLDNALRYAPIDSVVTVSLSTMDSSVALEVLDAGLGVSEEMIGRIFDRFVRVDDDRNRSSGGAGIGLAVCRKIIESRGGTIFATKREPQGLKVTCKLPIA